MQAEMKEEGPRSKNLFMRLVQQMSYHKVLKLHKLFHFNLMLVLTNPKKKKKKKEESETKERHLKLYKMIKDAWEERYNEEYHFLYQKYAPISNDK